MAVAKIQTPFGDAIPPFPKHSITAHLPGWSTILQIIENPQQIVAMTKSLYPRFAPFGNAKELVGRICQTHLKPGQMCLVFGSRDSAEACRNFAVSEKRKEEHRCEKDQVEVRCFRVDGIELWATTFPAPKTPGVIPFWQDPGTGVSSRISRHVLDRFDELKAVDVNEADGKGLSANDPAYGAIKERIIHYLNQAPISKRPAEAKSSDVFLYPTGMAAIYQTQRYLEQSGIHRGSTVLFGFAFHSTPHVFKEYSQGFKWFGKGDDDELKQLEEHCEAEKNAGRQVQVVWLEFPSNPNLKCADLDRLRTLADKHGFYLMIDDTISSFCSVDLFDHADVVITSLTKSFSGYADVMGGSAVINPSSKHYKQLLDLYNQRFTNELYVGDAQALDKNSTEYLQRSTTLNANALALVEYLQSEASYPSSAVKAVQYPTIGSNKAHYDRVKRPDTADFKPGYGCLLSAEFESEEATMAFYDTLETHKGPHLGAHYTLTLPYVKGILFQEQEWARECGMNNEQLRFSVGLEKTEDLLAVFRMAVEAASNTKKKDPILEAANPIV